jgi:hypothetical protein
MRGSLDGESLSGFKERYRRGQLGEESIFITLIE